MKITPKPFLIIWLILLSLFLQNPLHALEISVEVQSVYDGDTITVLYYELPLKIRFAHIDTPELKQMMGIRARNVTQLMCLGETATLNIVDRDSYGRYIGVITVNNKNVNKYLVEKGLAWWYEDYSNDRSYWLLQEEARNNKLGIWSQKRPKPPWKYRRNRRKARRSRTLN